MTNKRIFVKKRNGYNKEELQLRDNLNLEFNLDIDSVELYVIYDVFNIDEETYELAKTSVFSEIVVDEVFEDIELNDGKYFAYEVLPAQYDQRADSAKESIRLLNSKSKATVRSGKLVLFNKKLTDEQLELVESYLVNPIEARKKDLSILNFTLDSTPKPLKDLAGFLEFDKDALLGLKKEFSLAMNIEDLVFIQDYFKKEGRVPTETEIYVLDCYWSDHCRHTTFETVLDEVKIESELFQKEMQDAFDYYLKVRDELDRNDKPITLMDMASIIGKYHVKVLKDENIEVSEEINACSFFTTIENNGDGSGTYNDKDKDLLIENDGKGKAIITLKGKSTEVEAKPLEKPEKFPKLKMVPPVPSIEANSLLITLDSGILFDVDKYDVRPEAERALASLATVLKEADVKAFEIDGHTDSDASDEYNQALSEKRANAVKDFLASQGLTSEITIIGYGESRPVASNDTPEGKQKNRRVEILIPTI